MIIIYLIQSMQKREINYEIKMESSANTIKGSIMVHPKQSINSIREQIQKINNFSQNHLIVQSPQTATLPDNLLIIMLREKKMSNFRKYSDTSSIYFQEESMIQKNQSHEYIYQEPETPPKVVGRVKQCYKLFSCFSSQKIMVLNFESIKFVAGSAQQGGHVSRKIPLSIVEQVKPYKKKDYFFIRIRTTTKQTIDLKFINKDVCRQWINYFHQAINYHEYLEERENYSRNESFKNFVKTLLDQDNKRIVKLQDSTMLPKSSQEYGVLSYQSSNVKKKSSYKERPVLADFEVTHKIGSGAFSNVYKVIHKKTNKIYALKQMSKDDLLYKNQMKYAMTQLSILKNCHFCPFIINFGYAFQTEDYLYLAIKYMPFGNLKQLLGDKKTLSLDVAFKMLCELVIAIEYLHQRKILYRDLKPENIMLDGHGHISLIDFGLSIQLDQSAQFAESFVGTPLYIAPERLQGSGKINFKADIYGVGCIFYQMLHGMAPYQAQSLSSIVYNIKHTELQIRSDLPQMVKIFIQDTLQKTVQKRTSHLSSHPFFQGTNWKKVQKREQKILQMQQKTSQHFEVKNVNDHDYTEQNYPNKKIANWMYSS